MRYFINQRGAASLITVTLTSFLILIIVLGIAGGMTGELRQSTDTQSSTQAFYQAQSAAEEAVDYIRTRIGSIQNQSCDAASNPAGSLGWSAPISCIKITSSATDEAKTSLGPDVTDQYDLSKSVQFSSGSIDHLILSWDNSYPSPSGTFSDLSAAPLSLPSSNSPQPAVVEMTITNYTGPSSPSSSAVGQPGQVDTANSGTVFLVPQWCDSGDNCPDLPAVTLNASNIGSAAGSGVLPPVNCKGWPDYRCKVQINGITHGAGASGERTVVRLQFRGKGASYRLQAFESLGGARPIPLPRAQIDVTAQVGAATRRLVTEVPTTNQAQNLQVLYGDNDICKGFDILSDPSGYFQVHQPAGGCPLN